MQPIQWMRAVRDSDLPATARSVAWALGLRADRTGHCWPSYTAIARDCGLHRITVIRQAALLVDRGWLMLSFRTSRHGQQSNSYQLVTPVDNHAGSSTGLPRLVAQDYPPSSTGLLPGGLHRTTQKKKPREEEQREATAPVDNAHPSGHLGNVIGLLSKGTRLP